ncbi:MAG: T9SS type A sorting domain-containing protein [Bacteroidetes bacterium]|nr:T9SS type A sorting domain-containing protein [Bacteroidota bacterium]
MKKVILTFLLLQCSLIWVAAQVNELNVKALPQLVDLNIEKIWTGDLDHNGHLIFSVTEADNPIGLWEYILQPTQDSTNFLLDQPNIVDLVAYQSQYGDMNRIIYFLHWVVGTSNTYLIKYTDFHDPRPLIKYDKLMYGLEVSDVLNYGDVVSWGNKTTGETYDNTGTLTGLTRNGIIHGLLNGPDSTEYRAWTKDVGVIPGPQYCAIYRYQDTGKLIGGFGPADGEGYATRLLCTDGSSAILDTLPQPESVEYTWMGIVPHMSFANDGTTRFMAAGWVYDNPEPEYQLLIWNEDLTDYSVYQSFGSDFPGLFKVGSHVVDDNNNDALVLGGDNIDMEYLGFPADYSGLLFLNSAGWQPLEEILGYSFLNNDVLGIPDVRVLEYDKEAGHLWAAGKDIIGKDPSGEDILAGFLVTVEQLAGNMFAQISDVQEVQQLTKEYNLEAWPNPTTDILTVEANAPIGQVDVYDMSGKQVISIDNKLASSQLDLNLQKLPAGQYLLRIQMEKGIIAKLVQRK